MEDQGSSTTRKGENNVKNQIVQDILEKYKGLEEELIAVLQEIQVALHHVPEWAVNSVCEKMNVSTARAYGILTFYSQFRLDPPGKHKITLCQGTACHVMGARKISEYLENKLDVRPGSTTDDRNTSLDHVACLGCCGMAPVMVVDGEMEGKCTIRRADEILDLMEGGE